ncbi:hypothetical protein [Altericroceibacterium endophyticum]|uniref:Uncharacterized protein n=1 Tax=Altericroceibacterium endophyticum TaxID=1808508 RepID=A0A6I4TB37_9SPHN|nr:hypothetical protein [Altericroceibacterium endophyticum]MXO66955.1 hypothetical protein [Altericroceibacterium endophyticum]
MDERSKPQKLTGKGARQIRKTLDKTRGGLRKVPGPSTNPATNLMIADIGMRTASMLFRRTMEKGLLRARFTPEKAREVVEGRTLGRTLATVAISKVATRSVPGAVLVGGSILAKIILDRSVSRRQAEREGDAALEEQANQD